MAVSRKRSKSWSAQKRGAGPCRCTGAQRAAQRAFAAGSHHFQPQVDPTVGPLGLLLVLRLPPPGPPPLTSAGGLPPPLEPGVPALTPLGEPLLAPAPEPPGAAGAPVEPDPRLPCRAAPC